MNMQIGRLHAFAMVTTAALYGCAQAGERIPADLILTGGTVAVVDQDFSLAETIVIADGLVAAIGDASLLDEYEADRTIDLRGRLVVPGFNDTHTHIRGRAFRHIELGGVESIASTKASTVSWIAASPIA